MRKRCGARSARSAALAASSPCPCPSCPCPSWTARARPCACGFDRRSPCPASPPSASPEPEAPEEEAAAAASPAAAGPAAAGEVEAGVEAEAEKAEEAARAVAVPTRPAGAARPVVAERRSEPRMQACRRLRRSGRRPLPRAARAMRASPYGAAPSRTKPVGRALPLARAPRAPRGAPRLRDAPPARARASSVPRRFRLRARVARGRRTGPRSPRPQGSEAR